MDAPGKLSRRAFLAGIASFHIPAAAMQLDGPDSELIALGRQFDAITRAMDDDMLRTQNSKRSSL